MKFFLVLLSLLVASFSAYSIEVVVHPPYLKTIEGKRSFLNEGQSELVRISRPRLVYTNDEVTFEFEISSESDPNKVCELAKYGRAADLPKIDSAFFEKSIRVIHSDGTVIVIKNAETIKEIVCSLN